MTLSLPLTPHYTQLRHGGADSNNNEAEDGDFSILGHCAIAATLAFTLLVFLFEAYLDFRQRSSYHKTEFPPQLEMTVASIDAERKKELEGKIAADDSEEKEMKGKIEGDGSDGVDKNKPLLPNFNPNSPKLNLTAKIKLPFPSFHRPIPSSKKSSSSCTVSSPIAGTYPAT